MARKGENIFKRKDGRWEGRYIKGHNGKKAVYGSVFGKSYSEVKQKKAEAVSQLEIGQSRLKTQKRATSPNFENIARQWLEELKPIRKKSTIVKYMSQLKNYIIPAFGNFNLSDIGNEDIISFANKLLTEGNNGQKLSPKTVSDILSRMKSIGNGTPLILISPLPPCSIKSPESPATFFRNGLFLFQIFFLKYSGGIHSVELKASTGT